MARFLRNSDYISLNRLPNTVIVKDSTLNRIKDADLGVLRGSKTHDFASVASGATATTTVTVTGAALGDFAQASLSVAVPASAQLVATVTAADTVTVTLVNNTGGALDLASGTLSVKVTK